MVRSSCVTSLGPFWILPRWFPWHGQPTLPSHLAAAPEVSPLRPGSGRDVHPGAAYSRDKVMWVQSKLGWRGGHASGTQHDAEAPSARRGCWEGRQDLVNLHFPGIILLRWSLGVALTYSQGLRFSLTPCRILGRRNPGEGSCV